MLRIMAGKSSIFMQFFVIKAINRLKFADLIPLQFHCNRALQKFYGNYEKLLFEIALYYDVAGDALTSISIGIYATGSNSKGTQTVTLLSQGQNGLTLDEAYSVWSKALTNLPDAPPNSVIMVELDIATSGSGTAIVFGLFYR